MRTPEQRAEWAAYMRDWSQRHRDEVNAGQRARYARNRDARRAAARDRYATDPEYRDRLLAAKRVYVTRPTWIDRFWSHVARSEGCWLWTGAQTPQGYGAAWNGRRVARAHRVAYELEVGTIPTGLTLDHLCRNRACVNPGHLEPVTIAENVRRGNGGQHWAAKRTAKAAK